jgi:hypothetical protein
VLLESRKHGRFDLRWPQFPRVQQPVPRPDGRSEGPDGLDWEEFCNRYVATRRRHELQALNAYGAYRRERRWLDAAVRAQLPVLSGDPPSAPADPARYKPKPRDASPNTTLETWESEGGAIVELP